MMRRDPFQAIADPTRRAILGLIAKEALNLNSVAGHFKVSRPAISKHIKILSQCGLIEIRQQGRERFCEARLEGLGDVATWLGDYRQFWDAKFVPSGAEQVVVEIVPVEAPVADTIATEKPAVEMMPVTTDATSIKPIEEGTPELPNEPETVIQQSAEVISEEAVAVAIEVTEAKPSDDIPPVTIKQTPIAESEPTQEISSPQAETITSEPIVTAPEPTAKPVPKKKAKSTPPPDTGQGSLFGF